MVTFFPTPYEDELLYSTLGRYHIRSGNVSFDATMLDLFGKSNGSAVFELPTNLEYLISNMPINNKYTAEKIIYENPLYPYYAAFLPENRAKEVLTIMTRGNGTGIHFKLGIGAFSGYNKNFKFCVKCLEEDKNKYGEYYWHRSHQGYGVYICTRHGTQLSETVLPIDYFHKKEYKLPSDELCTSKLVQVKFNESDLIKLSKIAGDVKYLLESHLPFRDLKWFISQYKNVLIQRGLCTITGVGKMKDFIGVFKGYYGDNILNAMQLNINEDDNINWLKDMVRERGTARQAIKHILLCNFLGIDFYKLFNERIEYKPFGDAPWPCLNYVCKNYMNPVIKDVEIKNNSKHKSPIGTFKCTCGFTYVRKGPDKYKEDRLKVGYIKEFGEIWESKLKELILQGYSFKEIERRMGSYHETLKKYAIKLGLSDYVNERCEVIPNLNDKIEKEIDIEKRKMLRNQWGELRIKYPEFSITELRGLSNNLYDWLQKWDKEWMKNNSPIRRKRSVEKERIDWRQKDQEILENVKGITDGLLNPEEPPRKITISLIGRTLGVKSYLFSNLGRLPKTKEYIDTIVEDSRTYQLRKAKWAIRELEKEGEEIKF